MKIKKIITAMSCAALIAATALPLTACGGSKSFKKTKEEPFNISDYVEEYRPNGMLNDEYDLSAPEVVTVQNFNQSYSHPANTSSYGRITLFDKGTSPDYFFYAFNMYSGANVFNGLNGPTRLHYKQYQGVDAIAAEFYDKTNDKITYDVYAEDGSKLAEDVDDYNNIKVTKSKHKVKNAVLKDYFFDVLTVTYKKDGSEVKKYFGVEELKTGAMDLYEFEEDNIIFVDPLIDKGSAAFSTTVPISRFIAALNDDTSIKEIDGDLAAYSIGSASNDLVFYKDGEETGRVNMDGVSLEDGMKGIAFAGNYMYYAKSTSLPIKDKDVNLIYDFYGEFDTAVKYELHRYDILNDKDKTLPYTDFVINMESMYNNKTKAYDALVLSGAKVVNKVAQFNSLFSYIVDSELNINYDVSSVPDFDISDLSAINGKLLLEKDPDEHGVSPLFHDYTVLDYNLNVVSEFQNSHYYNRAELFSFTRDSGTGFARPDGTVAIEPKYTKKYGEIFTFYDGYTIATNNVTNETVFVKNNGEVSPLPNIGTIDSSHMDEGWYTVKTDSSFSIRFYNGGGYTVNNYKYLNVSNCKGNMLEFNVFDGTVYDMCIVNSARWMTSITL